MDGPWVVAYPRVEASKRVFFDCAWRTGRKTVWRVRVWGMQIAWEMRRSAVLGTYCVAATG